MKLLAIAPASRGFGFVVIETDHKEAIDWGVKDVRTNKNANSVRRASEIIASHRPEALVLEDWTAAGSKRRERTMRLMDQLERLAFKHSIPVNRIDYRSVQRAFERWQARTAHQRAEAVLIELPTLALRVPRSRKTWESERYATPIFKAAALALSFAQGSDV